jgi:hypothetical protein
MPFLMDLRSTRTRRALIVALASGLALGGAGVRTAAAQQRADSVRRAPTAPRADAPVLTVRIEGVVVDSLGRPVARAIVVPRATERGVITDSAGRFAADGLPLGESIVDVSGEGHESMSFQVVAPTGATVHVRVTLMPAAPPSVVSSVVPVLPSGGTPSVLPAAPAATSATGAPMLLHPPDSGVRTFPRNARSSIVGRVLDANDRPVYAATVQAMSSPYLARSDSSGAFRLTNLPLGPYFLRVRKVGYEPLILTVQLRTTDSADVDLRLLPASAGLDTVRVLARDPGRGDRLKGFNERRKVLAGTFIDEAEINRRVPYQLSDLLRGKPSVTVSNDGSGRQQLFGRNISISGGYCPMGLMIDGQFLNGTNGYMDFVEPNQVKAIEVYTSGPSVPSEFQRRQTDCGLVVVWTK